tara:strand:+ start:180 stop:476 length:297 start_codon:yes stop_codon:yes gene_type:complete
MSKRKYRIIEEKYIYVSHFYPQYKDENCDYYVLGQDENGKDIKSEYQYFGKFEDCGLVGNRQWKRDMYYSLPMARHRIEMDIQQQTTEELKETIVHEY